ncbi:MAG: hypothetical protein V1933_08295 [Candidatus Omnitrophota bacterium]
MSNAQNIKKTAIEILSSKVSNQELFWSYEDSPVIVDFPDGLIYTNKIAVLELFFQNFQKTVANRSRLLELKDYMTPFLKNIQEVDSFFVSFVENKEKINIIVLLNNKKYDRAVAEKLFEVRLSIEDKYIDYEVEFLAVPRFDRNEEDLVSKFFTKIYP